MRINHNLTYIHILLHLVLSQYLSSKYTFCINFKHLYVATVHGFLAYRQNATGPSSVCEGSDVTLQCVIIFTNPSDEVTVQPTIWNRNGIPVIETINSSGTFYIPNHSQLRDPITGLPSDLVITNVRLEDDNIVYTCTASGSDITSSVILNVTGKLYVYRYVNTIDYYILKLIFLWYIIRSIKIVHNKYIYQKFTKIKCCY